MAGEKIGLLGQFNDADIQLLKAKIEDRGGVAKIIDPSLVPDTVKTHITQDSIIFDGENLLDFDAFYIRKLAAIWSLPVPQFSTADWENYYQKLNDRMDYLRAVHSYKLSLTRILCEKKLVVNSFEAWDYHHLKILQYYLLREKGFKVPAFVASNNYFALKEFLDRYPAVEKPVVTGPVRRVHAETLEAQRERLREHPVIYQEYIEGTSIRAFVLDNRIITACALPRKEWDVDASEKIEHMQPIRLSDDIQKEIVRAARVMGMVFSGVDLQYRHKTDEYFFLECNVAPYFRPYDAQAGADIGGKLADFLLERA